MVTGTGSTHNKMLEKIAILMAGILKFALILKPVGMPVLFKEYQLSNGLETMEFISKETL